MPSSESETAKLPLIFADLHFS